MQDLEASLYKKPGPSADFEKVKEVRYLKEILILNSFYFEDKEPRVQTYQILTNDDQMLI